MGIAIIEHYREMVLNGEYKHVRFDPESKSLQITKRDGQIINDRVPDPHEIEYMISILFDMKKPGKEDRRPTAFNETLGYYASNELAK